MEGTAIAQAQRRDLLQSRGDGYLHGMSTSATRFPIRFDPLYGLLSRMLLIPPSRSYVEVFDDRVDVRMAGAFDASFPRSSVVAAAKVNQRFRLTRGAHGWGGRWLVNGSGDGIVAIDLKPRQRAYVVGFPVKLQQLMVSVDEPERLIAALKAQAPER